MDLVYSATLLAGFWVLGQGIKYIDSAFDDKLFDQKAALLGAFICGIIMGSFIALDPFAASVCIAIILGVAFAKKIDNIAFLIGTVLSLSIPILIARSFDAFYAIPIVPVIVLVIGGVFDELGNDFADKGRIKNKLLVFFFQWRLTMELFAGILVFAGYLPFIYWVAFAFFDLGYHMATLYSERVKQTTSRLAKS